MPRVQRNRILLLASVLVAISPAWAGDLDPPGPPAPTMKTLVEVEPRAPLQNDFQTLMPVVITQPGSYYLAEDIFAFGAAHGILIQASQVTLDLNGFTVYGNVEVGSNKGILCDIGNAGVVIKNGTVRDFFQTGIDLFSCPNSRVLDVHALNNGLGGFGYGIFIGQDSAAVGCIAADNATDGLRSDFGSSFVRCSANDNGGIGINASVSVVDRCIARGNGGDGIRNANGLILHSLATNSAEDGIDATNSIVQSNSAPSNTGVNIDPDANSTIIENNQ